MFDSLRSCAAGVRGRMSWCGGLMFLVAFSAAAQPPAGRVHVRHIEFHEVEGIRDDVLRREMVQLEGAVLDTLALERSRQGLEALPYIENARIGLRPVEGMPDVVDVVVAIEQLPWRHYGGGGAYSDSLQGSLHAYFINENLFGSGQLFSLQIEASPLQWVLDISHTEPYATPAGVSRTLGFRGRRLDRLTADTSALRADLYNLSLDYGYRLADAQTLWLGGALRHIDLASGDLTSAQLTEWIANNGNPRLNEHVGTRFREVGFVLQWRHDTRDRSVFPRRGLEQTVSTGGAVPGSRVEYYTVDYRLAAHRPLGGWTGNVRTRLAFGRSYRSRTTSLPPHLNWFAGGPDTVRGFRENRLGPRDSLGNPYGGNLLISTQLELMRPLPGRWGERAHAGVFYDVGNVFSTEDVAFRDAAGERLDFGFDLGELRHSVGVAVHWIIPLGTLRLSYGVPLNAEDDHPNRFLRDDVDRTQISLGVNF